MTYHKRNYVLRIMCLEMLRNLEKRQEAIEIDWKRVEMGGSDSKWVEVLRSDWSFGEAFGNG